MSDSTEGEKIPFAVEIGRMIELLAAQIYPSPFALLRENVQNSFDAILMRRHLGQSFEPRISVEITSSLIRVTDNGVGMSRQDLKTHFWRAGSSSKNTAEARAAGVVGTFGIGAMANFGMAEELTVTTESAVSGERTVCSARRSTLSVTEDCIDFATEPPSGNPGTTISAVMQPDKSINVEQARAYIAEFVSLVPVDVLVNEQLVSKQPIEGAVPKLVESWGLKAQDADLGGGLQASVELGGAITGEIRLDLTNIKFGGQDLQGRLIVRQGIGTLRTFRSRFGLAATALPSAYGFGGVADFAFLQPTAGREAITSDGTQLLQRLLAILDDFVSLQLGSRPESNASSNFVAWAAKRKRFDLCANLRVRIEPGDSAPLSEVKKRSEAHPVLVYAGTDQALIGHASDERPLVVISRGSPRKDCELGYLRKYCQMEELTDEPKIISAKAPKAYSPAESALAFRLSSILSSDYFLDAEVKFAQISHQLPILVKKTVPVCVYLDAKASSAQLILQVYERDYGSFSHMAKDFARSVIFPRVADLVPSATRQGAEAFLKSVHRNREVFEYETADLESLTTLWKDYLSGKLDMPEAARKAKAVASRSYQVLDSGASAPVRDVVPDVVDNAALMQAAEGTQMDPAPPIQRLDIETDRKLLTIPDGEPPLKGFSAFLAITDRVREERGDFFLQPHRTSVVWGGQRALFIFEHHSGQFGLYYDVQTLEPIVGGSGGGSYETCTIVMKNRIFIPLPKAIEASFLPKAGEKKRVEVRCDILHIDRAPDGQGPA